MQITGRMIKYGMLGQIFKVLSSQVFLGVVGILTLPIAARGFGVDNYGVFSLFVILLGVIYVFDVSRIISTTKLSCENSYVFNNELKKLINFTFLNAVFVAVLACILGNLLLGFKQSIILFLIGFFYTISGLFFSILSVKEMVGNANIIKNISFAIAYCLSAGNAFNGGTVLVSMYFFLFANILILFLYFFLVKKNIYLSFANLITYSLDFTKLKSFEWSNVASLALFNLSGSVLTTTDKSILKNNTSSNNFGIYAGQGDLALKINMISNAIGTALFPEFAKLVQNKKITEVRNLISNALLLGGFVYFVVIYTLIHFSTPIITFILGDSYLSELDLFSFFLIGVFANYTSFLTVPLQRAYGDYNLSKNFYLISATLVLCLGIFLIKNYGIVGALVCYFIPRLVDVILVLVTFIKYFKMNTKTIIALVMYFIELFILIWKVILC